MRRHGFGGNRSGTDVRGGEHLHESAGLRPVSASARGAHTLDRAQRRHGAEKRHGRRGRATMKFTVRGALARCATRRVGLGALAGVVACVAGLVWRHDRLGGLALLDARGWYTPQEAAALFDALDALDANARLVYAATGLTIDMAFPVAYGLLFSIVLLRLFRAPLFVLPLALAVSDALENLTVAALALGHAGPASPAAWLAGGLTLVKTVLVFATLAATGAGAACWLRGRIGR